MINNIQQKIIEITQDYLSKYGIANLDDAVKNFITKLNEATNQEFTTAQDSNIYILVEFFLKELQQKIIENITYNAILIQDVYNSEKFSGYIAGNYIGFVEGMKLLDFIDDCKILAKDNNKLQIILLGKDNINIATAPYNLQIATKIHELNPLKPTFKGDAGFITQKVNGSWGQEIEYYYYPTNLIGFDVEISYTLDYEEFVVDLNYADKIKNAFNEIYTKLYNKIGKDYRYRDFLGLTMLVDGISFVSIKIKYNGIEEIDKDIAINIQDKFIINKIDTKEV